MQEDKLKTKINEEQLGKLVGYFPFGSLNDLFIIVIQNPTEVRAYGYYKNDNKFHDFGGEYRFLSFPSQINIQQVHKQCVNRAMQKIMQHKTGGFGGFGFWQ